MKPFIVCAAIKIETEEGKEPIIVCGPRHGDCINHAVQHVKEFHWAEGHDKIECGFVDQDMNFYSRAEAWKIADDAGEIRRPTGWERDYSNTRKPGIGDEAPLFSENLY